MTMWQIWDYLENDTNISKIYKEKLSSPIYNIYLFIIWYKIDPIATWMSLREGSLLYISKISEADCAKFNKIMSLGGRQYRLRYW